MKKSSSVVIAVIVVLVLAVGGYFVFHKSPKTTPSTSSTNSTAPAVNNAVLITKTDASLGQYLATPDGLPLYTYGSDSAGVSKCTGSCLANWPAYQDTGSTSGLPAGVSTIKRSDNGQTQFTYNGLPLYTFASDSKGHVTGDGVDNFKVAKPAAASASSSSSNSSQTTNSSSSSNPYNY